MDRKFSRIENLWPRDGSCPLPLRSKRIFNDDVRFVVRRVVVLGIVTDEGQLEEAFQLIYDAKNKGVYNQEIVSEFAPARGG